MTPKQRKDYIANCLLAEGVNKSSILAMLLNSGRETGQTFDPKILQSGVGPGYGLWQWSNYNSERSDMIAYAQNHTDKDCIKYECHVVVHTSQWLNVNGDGSLSDFLHNKNNFTYQRLTWSFLINFERGPVGERNANYAKSLSHYSFIMPIHWTGDKSDNHDNTGTGTGGGKTPHTEHKKIPKDNCLNLMTKGKKSGNRSNPNDIHNKDTHNSTNDKPNPGGSFPISKMVQLYDKCVKAGLQYSMGLRGHVMTDHKWSDCSAFVSYAVELCLGINDRTLYNTESLHGFLKRNGYKQIHSTSGTSLSSPKPGDVFIIGMIGTSLGVNGHTLIMGPGGDVYECTDANASNPYGVRHSPVQARIDHIHAWWFGGNWWLYQYRRD